MPGMPEEYTEVTILILATDEIRLIYIIIFLRLF
jgi:hypothetical protein